MCCKGQWDMRIISLLTHPWHTSCKCDNEAYVDTVLLYGRSSLVIFSGIDWLVSMVLLLYMPLIFEKLFQLWILMFIGCVSDIPHNNAICSPILISCFLNDINYLGKNNTKIYCHYRHIMDKFTEMHFLL